MRFWKLIGALLFVLLVLLAGAAIYALRPDAPPEKGWSESEAWFRDVTDAVGLDFVHDAGELSKYQMPQIVGSGAALFDFDGDGLLDIYLLTNAGPDSKSINRLYKNMGGTFKDVTAGSGLGIAGYNMGVAIGDINNDGLPDVLVTQYGGVKLFLNQGNGVFKDVTLEAGLKNPLWATSANFFDYDRDGRLDLVVVNYVDYDSSWPCGSPGGEKDYCAPKVFHGTVTKLFRNLGHEAKEPAPSVRFEDVTVAAGLAKAPGPGLGVYCADFNGDGWPDIFIANDGQANHLWINQKNGTFTEEAFARGLAVDAMAQAQANMGVAIGDVNNDLLFDLFITHLTSERNTLWLQGPKRGLFRDRTAFTGLLHSDWRGTGFGTVMGDFDQDGWLDIAVANGRVSGRSDTVNEALGDHLKRYGERNQLFRNEGQESFRDVSRLNPAFCGSANVARGLAQGDLSGTGSLDLLVTTVAGRARLLRNVAPARGHWLMVQAIDPQLKRDAYGAEITVRAGARRWLRIVNPGDSYLCSSDPRAHFGMGDAARFDEVHVLWPDGLSEIFPAGDANRLLVLRRGDGRPAGPIEIP